MSSNLQYYTKSIPCKNLKGEAKNVTVYFHLFEREVFKLLREFQMVFGAMDRWNQEDARELLTEEVVEFYTNFEEILLTAYGRPKDDDMGFEKGSLRYDFEESVVFNAAMMMYIQDQKATTELLDGLMPKGLQEMVKAADANLADLANKEDNSAELQAQIERLRAQLPESERDA